MNTIYEYAEYFRTRYTINTDLAPTTMSNAASLAECGPLRSAHGRLYGDDSARQKRKRPHTQGVYAKRFAIGSLRVPSVEASRELHLRVGHSLATVVGRSWCSAHQGMKLAAVSMQVRPLTIFGVGICAVPSSADGKAPRRWQVPKACSIKRQVNKQPHRLVNSTSN